MMIQSPSGNMLSPQQYWERPDRKMTLAERKKLIRSNTEKHIRMRGRHEVLAGEDLAKEGRVRENKTGEGHTGVVAEIAMEMERRRADEKKRRRMCSGFWRL